MSSYVLVDTDVFSYIWQARDQARPFEDYLRGKTPVLSFTTIAELHFGAAKNGWGETRMRQLEAAIEVYVVVPYDPEMAKLWGTLKSKAQNAGHALGHSPQTNDLWIATTAIFHDAPLMTHNRKHFEGMPGLTLANPRPW